MISLDIAFYILIVVVVVQGVYFLFVFGKLAYYKVQPTDKKIQLPVSVVICAKNEADNLNKFLPSIIHQDYSVFEVVLINDNSSDNTLEVMQAYAKKYPNIKIVNVKPVEAFWGNKKYPLTLGIKASKYNRLLFTDADCKPVSQHWITEMTAQLSRSTSIVLGYGAYAKVKKSFLNKLIRFETLTTAISYFSLAKIGLPYMGVGRNLAYTKQQFFKVNGFVKHMDIASGDDDLFVNQTACKSNTTICISPDSFTESTPKNTLKSWLRQKRRHISTASFYKTKYKILLASFYATNLLFWSLSIVLLVFWHIPHFVLALMLIRVGILYFIYGKSANTLNEKDLIVFLPLLELVLILFQLAIFITNKISKPKYWK